MKFKSVIVTVLILGISVTVQSYRQRPSSYNEYDCDSHEDEPPELPSEVGPKEKGTEEVDSSGQPMDPPQEISEEKQPPPAPPSPSESSVENDSKGSDVPDIVPIPSPDEDRDKHHGDDEPLEPKEVSSSETMDGTSSTSGPEVHSPEIPSSEQLPPVHEEPKVTIPPPIETTAEPPKVLELTPSITPTPCPGFNRPCTNYFDCGFQSGSNDTRIWFSCDGKFCVCELLGSVRDEEAETTWSVRWSKKRYQCTADLDGPCGFNNGLEVVCQSGTRCMADKTCNKPGRVKVNKKTTPKPKQTPDCDDDGDQKGVGLFSLLFFPHANVVDSILNASLTGIED